MRGGGDHERQIEAALSRGDAARSPLVASWNRSHHLHHLDPSGPVRPDRLTEAEIALARERVGPLLALSTPLLDRLFLLVGGIGCCVLFADRDGVPLERRGAAGDDVDFAGRGLWIGHCWSEAAQGTNGIGTALVDERPVAIFRDQHYLTGNTALSCMSAPVYDGSGQLAGVIDVSSARADLTQSHMGMVLHLVADTARQIEADLFRARFPAARLVVVPGAPGGAAALVAVDADDLVIGATRAARAHLRLSDTLSGLPQPAADLLGLGVPDDFGAAERAVLARALAREGGNVSAAARRLGISRTTFHRKIGSPAPKNSV